MCIACKSIASLGVASAILFGGTGEGQAGAPPLAMVAGGGELARDPCQNPDFQGGIWRGDAVYTNAAAQGAAAV